MKAHIAIPQEQLAAFCLRWQIAENVLLRLCVRDDFRPDSDIECASVRNPEAHHTLFDMVHMQDELQYMLGRKV